MLIYLHCTYLIDFLRYDSSKFTALVLVVTVCHMSGAGGAAAEVYSFGVNIF